MEVNARALIDAFFNVFSYRYLDAFVQVRDHIQLGCVRFRLNCFGLSKLSPTQCLAYLAWTICQSRIHFIVAFSPYMFNYEFGLRTFKCQILVSPFFTCFPASSQLLFPFNLSFPRSPHVYPVSCRRCESLDNHSSIHKMEAQQYSCVSKIFPTQEPRLTLEIRTFDEYSRP